jgi:hypothetical protein
MDDNREIFGNNSVTLLSGQCNGSAGERNAHLTTPLVLNGSIPGTPGISVETSCIASYGHN